MTTSVISPLSPASMSPKPGPPLSCVRERMMTALSQAGAASARDSNLVPLQRSAGENPVFCLHSVGGGTLGYWDLARLWPAVTRVIGVESAGLHGHPAPETKVGTGGGRGR